MRRSSGQSRRYRRRRCRWRRGRAPRSGREDLALAQQLDYKEHSMYAIIEKAKSIVEAVNKSADCDFFGWFRMLPVIRSDKENPLMSTTRRSFASRIACLFTGVGAASLLGGRQLQPWRTVVSASWATTEKRRRHRIFTPLIVYNEVIYIAGQGAHSRNPNEQFPQMLPPHNKSHG